jgi:hypothetical protein
VAKFPKEKKDPLVYNLNLPSIASPNLYTTFVTRKENKKEERFDWVVGVCFIDDNMGITVYPQLSTPNNFFSSQKLSEIVSTKTGELITNFTFCKVF